MVPRDRIELPTRGFSDQLFENSKMLQIQAVDSIPIFQLTFGFVWKYLTLTGTIRAQFSVKILILKQINVLFFHPEIKFWILTIFFEKQNQISQLVSFSDFLVFWFLQNLADFPDAPRKVRTGLCSLTRPP